MRNKQVAIEPSHDFRWLNPDEIHKPQSVIKEFFRSYHVKEVREELWEWLSAGLTNSNEYYNTAKDRSNLIFLYENLAKLLEASWLMQCRYTPKKKNTSSKLFHHTALGKKSRRNKA